MNLRELFWRRWVGILLVVIMFGLGWSMVRVVGERIRLGREINELQESVNAQEAELQQYQALLDKINNFTYIETQARLKFGLKRPGENVFVVPDSFVANQTNTSAQKQNPQSNPELWWNYFFERRGG